MFSDVRQAARLLLKTPAFTVTVAGVLALGIGANTAIFSLVYGVLLKPLPYANPARLVAIQSVNTSESGDDSAAYPDFVDWRAGAASFDGMAAFTSFGPVPLTGAGEPTAVQSVAVTSDFTSILGVAPIVGRALSAEDDLPNAPASALISETLWVRRFARDPAVVGRSIVLDGKGYTVVGVLPASFQFPIQPEHVDVWASINAWPLAAAFASHRGAHFVNVIGRLREGRSIESARAELLVIAGRLAAAYPQSNKNRSVAIVAFRRSIVKDVSLALMVLLGAVAAVLLIACANVANLLLARGTSRRQEMAIRAALGASRLQLLRQLLTESLLLSAVGGVAGVALAYWSLGALLHALPGDLPRSREVTIDGAVLGFSVLLTFATGVLFGLMPAFQFSNADSESLKESARVSGSRRTTWTRHGLIVGEVALSLVLLAVGGLLLRTLLHLQRVDTGFLATHTLTSALTLPEARYPDDAAQRGVYRRLLERVATVPGVRTSGASTTLPLTGDNLGMGFVVDDRPPAAPGDKRSASTYAISPGYFSAMGIGIVRGRGFTERDRENAPLVLIVNETMARQYWPNGDAIGKRVTLGYKDEGSREIVGIARDVKQVSLSEQAVPQMYVPYPQMPWPFLSLVVRTDRDPAGIRNALRSAITEVDPSQAAVEIRSVQDFVTRSLAAPRFNAGIVAAFAVFAALLAGLGLYGVTSYAVSQRRREFGIRCALGAQPADILRLVGGQALRLGTAGLAIGLLGSIAAARLVASLLFGIGTIDVPAFAGACALMLGILAVASYIPARRATRVDPAVTLRAGA